MWSRLPTKVSPRAPVRVMSAGHTEWIGNDKSATHQLAQRGAWAALGGQDRGRGRAAGPAGFSGYLWSVLPEAEELHDGSAPDEAVLCKGRDSAEKAGSDAKLSVRCAVGHNRMGGRDSQSVVNLLVNKVCRSQ